MDRGLLVDAPSHEIPSIPQSSLDDADSEPGEHGQVPREEEINLVGGVRVDDEERIGGVPVYLKAACKFKGIQYQKRYGIHCPNKAHKKCLKSRAAGVDADHFGPFAWRFYLGCWAHKCTTLDRDAHHKWRPTRAEIEVWRRETGNC